MRKNTLSIILSNLQSQKTVMEKALEAELTFAARRDLEKNHVLVVGLMQGLDDLVEKTVFTPASDFQWEFDGGSAKVTAHAALSALNTAYFAVFYAWRRERRTNDTMVNGRALSLPEIAIKKQMDEIFGFEENSEYDTHLSLEETIANAAAVYSYNLHISRFEGLRWMTGFDVESQDGERSTVNLLLPFSFWCNRRAVEVSPNHTLGQLYRDCGKEVGDVHMPIDDAKVVVKNWLYEPCDDGTYSDRNTRIINRVADSQVDKMFTAMKSRFIPDLKTALNKMSLWELIICSDLLKRTVDDYKMSGEYLDEQDMKALDRLEAKAEQLAEAQVRAERRAKMAEREKAINARIDAILNPKPVKAVPAKASVPKAAPKTKAKAKGAPKVDMDAKLKELQKKYPGAKVSLM